MVTTALQYDKKQESQQSLLMRCAQICVLMDLDLLCEALCQVLLRGTQPEHAPAMSVNKALGCPWA